MKKTVVMPVLVLSFCLCGCETKSTKGDDQTPNKTIPLKLFEAFNKHDWQLMASYYSDTADFVDPAYGLDPVKQSHQDLIKKYSGLQKMFPDIKDSIVATYADGQHVIVEFVASGMTKEGQKFRLPMCTVLMIQNGQIVRDATYYDQ